MNLEPMSIGEVLGTLSLVANSAGVPDRAMVAIEKLKKRIDAVAERSRQVKARPRVVFLEWLDPPFSCGHWTPELIGLAGGDEVIARPGQRSRTIQWEEVVAARPDVLFIACCGFSVERTLSDLPGLASRPGWTDLPAAEGRARIAGRRQLLLRED